MRRKVPIAVGEYYHLYNRGVEKRDIFVEEGDYHRFLSLMHLSNRKDPVNLHEFFLSGKKFKDVFAEAPAEKIVAIGAYCLMPNHFHLLIKEIVEGGASLFMKKLSTGYAMYFNAKNSRSGALFQGRYKSQHVDSDTYLKYLFSYIHLNPAKLVDKGWEEGKLSQRERARRFVESYPYSSHKAMSNKDEATRALLAPEAFPDYFTRPKDIDDIIDIWEQEKDRPF